METWVSEVEDKLVPAQKDIRTHSLAIAALQAKADDLENRSRRNNIWLVGVPEKTEGANPSDYFESWIQTIFGKETLSPFFAIERAHMVPLHPLRLILIKLLHFKDRDIIL